MTRITRRGFGRLVAVTSIAGLGGGCSLLGLGGGGGSTDTYDLTAPKDVKVGAGTTAQILVPEPVALKALDTERIVVRPRAGEINYLSGAQWSDRLPKLVQSRLVQTFENSGRVRAVGRPGQGLLIDWQVVGDIRSFEFDAGLNRAVVEVSIKLMNDKTGRVVATQVFRAEAETGGDAPKAIVAGLDQASDKLLRDVVAWTLKRS